MVLSYFLFGNDPIPNMELSFYSGILHLNHKKRQRSWNHYRGDPTLKMERQGVVYKPHLVNAMKTTTLQLRMWDLSLASSIYLIACWEKFCPLLFLSLLFQKYLFYLICIHQVQFLCFMIEVVGKLTFLLVCGGCHVKRNESRPE